MNKNFLIILSVLSLISYKTHAQEVVLVTDEAPQVQYDGMYPEVLVHIPPAKQDNVIMQNTSFVDSEIPADNGSNPKEESSSQNVNTDNTNISYYVQNLNLTPEQIGMAQRISDESRAKQEQLLQDIQALRQRAHEIEEKSLTDFEEILTPKQKTEFLRLRGLSDNANIQNNQKTETQTEPENEIKQEEKAENNHELKVDDIVEQE